MGYFIIAAIAGVCFLASLLCHILGWLRIDPPLGHGVFVLHVGIFVFWLPLVVLANRTMPQGAKNNMGHLFAALRNGSPAPQPWCLLMPLQTFSSSCTPPRDSPNVVFHYISSCAGFSGHWMVFYGMAIVGFTALGRLAQPHEPVTIIVCSACTRSSGSRFPHPLHFD